MSEFISICPKCRQQILCDTAYVGKRVACPMCLQEITMPSPPSQSAQSGQAPAQGAPSTPSSKKSPVAMIAIIGGVVVALAAGAAFFVLHKPSQTAPPASTASRAPATPAPVATPIPQPVATPTPVATPPPEAVPTPVVHSTPKPPVNLNQPGPMGAFDQSCGHYIDNANGYAEIFAVDSSGYVVHKSNSGAGTSWGQWSRVSSSDGYVGHPAVYCGIEGAVNVFVLNGSQHIIMCFNRVNFTSTWNEISLGGDIGSDASVIMNENQYLEVFATGRDGGLAHNWSTDSGNSWNGWVTLGVGDRGRPAAVVRNDGGAEVFVRRTDNSMDHYAHPHFSIKWNQSSLNGSGFASDPWAVQASDSHVEAFCIKSNGTLWHTFNHGTATQWSGWSEFDTGGALMINDLFASVTKNGDTIVYGRQASDGAVGVMEENANGWGQWGPLQGAQ